MKNYFIPALAFIVIFTHGCVTMKSFTNVSDSATKLKADSTNMAAQIAKLQEQVDRLTISTIDLGRDTLRLYSDIVSERENYNEQIEEYKYEIAALTAQVQGSSRHVNRYVESRGGESWQKSVTMYRAIAKSIKGIAEEMRLILRTENPQNYTLLNTKLELSVMLSDELLFAKKEDGTYDRNSLSSSGVAILGKIGAAIVSKANYDIVIREYIGVDDPTLENVPSASFIEQPLATKEAVLATINSMIEQGLFVYSIPKHLTEPVKVDSMNVEGLSVIDPEQVRKQDSIKYVNDVALKLEKQAEHTAQMTNQIIQEKALEDDRTTIIIKELIDVCYNKLGSHNISKDATYRKSLSGNIYNGIEIIFRPNAAELYDLLKGEK